MRRFTTSEKPPKPSIQFAIDDREMTFTPPGWAPLLLAVPEQGLGGLTRIYLDWLGAGLSDEDGNWILDRLMDPEDEFDLVDIQEVIFGVMEEVTGRPIVLPSDSSSQEETLGSTDGQRRKALTQRGSR
jgi:hypothetical protein